MSAPPTDPTFLAPRKRHPVYLERRSILEALGRLRRHVQPGRILDVGCGTKPYANLLAPPGSLYWGVDYPVTMAQSHQSATRADVWADCQRLPFASESLDTVITTQVLEHVPHPPAFMAELARVLRPGGSLILSAPMVWPLHEEPYDFYRYTLYGLRTLFQRAGFEVLEEVPRGAAASALGQMLLDLHLPQRREPSLLGKAYRNALALAINQTSLWVDHVWPNRRLCLGYAFAARRSGGASS
jgi:SAM-dependent methyltransferase